VSAEAVTYALLSAASAVTAVVSDRIYPGQLPLEAQPPAIVYELIDAVPEGNIDTFEATHVTRSRVQVNLIAADYAVLHNTLRNAVVGAMRNQRGTFGGVVVHAIMLDHDGTPNFDQGVELWHRPIDFIIYHQQP
jgi:hypothetical protein